MQRSLSDSTASSSAYYPSDRKSMALGGHISATYSPGITAPPYTFVAELPGSEVIAPMRAATTTPTAMSRRERREWPVWEEVPRG